VWLLLCVLPLFIGATIAAQDMQPQAPSHSARLVGTVTAADTGRPIRGAALRLVRWDRDRGFPMNAATTDDDGRFELFPLSAGSYQLSATADGYLSGQYGQRLPSDLPKRIELTSNQSLVKADIALLRKSAIEGRVTDQFGVPAANIAIQVARIGFLAGKTRMLPVPDGNTVRLTDDLGRFRIFGLAPGDYYVVALSGLFATLPGGLSARTDMATAAAGPPRSVRRAGFAPTFYPGTSAAASAQPVHVDAGVDTGGISFALVPSSLTTISGLVVDAAQQPVAGARLTLLQLYAGDVRAMIPAETTAGPNGGFTFRDVPSGTYSLQAIQPGLGLCGTGFGSSVLTVADREVRDLVVRVAHTTSVHGRIVFDSADKETLPAPTNVRVRPANTDFVASPVVGGGVPYSNARDNWTFAIAGMCGRSVLRLVAPSPWLLKSVVHDGVDVTDLPIDFGGGDMNDFTATLTSRAGSLSGRVLDANGQAAPGNTVILFSEDPAKWTYPSRYLFEMAVSSEGSFMITGVLPGAYLVATVRTPLRIDWQDPQVLGTFNAIATRVVVLAGEARTVQLKVVR
jgi:5-hydroxyisourate hydrolase-like protein (transthyretin family)